MAARGKKLVSWVAAGAVGAGLADAAENYALIQIMLGAASNSFGLSAALFASVKFGLLAIALLTWAGIGVRRARERCA